MTTDELPVTGLSTLQWSWGGLFNGRPVMDICLVRSTSRGTPGPTLCGQDRFAKSAPGWSVGGGVTGPGVVNERCAACEAVRSDEFPTLPVCGMFKGLFGVGGDDMTNKDDGSPSERSR